MNRPIGDLTEPEFVFTIATFAIGFTIVTAYAETAPYAAVLGAILVGYYSNEIERWAKQEIDDKRDRRDVLEEWEGSTDE